MLRQPYDANDLILKILKLIPLYIKQVYTVPRCCDCRETRHGNAYTRTIRRFFLQLQAPSDKDHERCSADFTLATVQLHYTHRIYPQKSVGSVAGAALYSVQTVWPSSIEWCSLHCSPRNPKKCLISLSSFIVKVNHFKA